MQVGAQAPVASANGREAADRAADMLDAAGRDAKHPPCGGALGRGMGKVLHTEEVQLSDQALAVTINDVLSKHVSMVPPLKHSTQATMAEHSFGDAV